MSTASAGVLAHALGMHALPEGDGASPLLARFSLRQQGLLDGDRSAPLLVVGGTDRPPLPEEDRARLGALAGTAVWRVQGAPDRSRSAAAKTVAWLRRSLHGPAMHNRMLDRATGILLRSRSGPS
jgi:hypothetical protein